MRKFTIKSLLIAAALCLGTSAWAEDKVVEIGLSSHASIVGTGMYETFDVSKMYLNSYAKNGGAAAMKFILDESFDAGKVKDAKLQLYVISKPTSKKRSGTVSFFSLDELTVASETYKTSDDGNAIVYSYGGDNTKRYAYTGTAFTSAAHNTSGESSYMAVGVYNDVDITDYVKGLTDKNPSDAIYIGMSISDFAADTYIGGWGNENPAKIVITYTDEEIVEYAINYKFGGETIASDTGNEVVGTTVTGKKVITVGDQKYFVESGEVPSLTTVSGTNVLDVPLRKAYSATLNLTTIIDGNSTTEEITFVEADDNTCSWSYGYPLYIKSGDVYYVADNTDTFGESGTFIDGQTIDKEVTYTNVDETVVFFAEGESASGTNHNYSNSGTGTVASQNARDRGISVGTLPAGQYEFIVNIASEETNRRSLVIRQSTNDPLASVGLSNEDMTTGLKTATFTLEEETSSLFVNGANSGDSKTNLSVLFDYVLVKKIPTEVSTTITEAGYATFSSAYAVDFSAAEGLTAYTAKVNDGNATITLTAIEDGIVPANTGVILKGEAGDYTGAITTTEATVDNDLKANATEITGNGSIYVLNNGTKGIGFYQLSETGTLAAGKAYLEITSSAKAYTFVWNESTGIEENYEFGTMSSDAATYDLSGRKVANPAKGLYIKNGKKFIVK